MKKSPAPVQPLDDSDARAILAADCYAKFMRELGLPLDAETMETPLRVAKMFLRDFNSHNHAPPIVACFERKGYDQYIVETGIEFASICQHHHLTFDGQVMIGYHPKEKLAGLSKLARVVHYFAARPQLQEHLVVEIAEYLFEQLDPHGVMVVARARHSCMSCRGVRSVRAETTTSKIIESPDMKMDKMEMMRLMGL